MAISYLVPGTPAPPLNVPLVGGGRFNLVQAPIRSLQMVVFYRGRFCVVCKKYIPHLARLRTAFDALGIDLIALSADNRADAEEAAAAWGLDDLSVGYDLSVEDMRRWGAYVSKGDTSLGQPEVFAEPSLFLVKPDRSVFFVTLNSAPGGRPNPDELLEWLSFVVAKKPSYPTRGGYFAV